MEQYATASSLTADISLSGNRVRTAAFDGLHPIAALVYFVGALVLSACSFHPWLAGCAFACGVVYSVVARGAHATKKTMIILIPLILLLTFLNPFFSGQGATLLVSVLGRPVYFEGLVFGMCMGLLMAAMLIWAQSAACTITAEEALSLVSGPLPTIALMLSMVARLVPRYIRQGEILADVEAANTAAARSGVKKVVRASRRFTTLFGSAIEDSLITADSLASRGWKSNKARTSYKRICFTQESKIVLACIAVLIVLASIATVSACAGFNFYPYMDPVPFKPIYLGFIAFFIFPLVLEAREVAKWKQ